MCDIYKTVYRYVIIISKNFELSQIESYHKIVYLGSGQRIFISGWKRV